MVKVWETLIRYEIVIQFMVIFPFILANIVLIDRFYLYLIFGANYRKVEQKVIKEVIFQEFPNSKWSRRGLLAEN